jgi:hypothetical protein
MARESEPADERQPPVTPSRPGIPSSSARPMAGAVVAAIVLTLLLPASSGSAPRWLLPLIERALLVAVIVGDPGRINRRTRLLRAISIALVFVLVFGTSGRPAFIEYLYLGFTNATALFRKPGPGERPIGERRPVRELVAQS